MREIQSAFRLLRSLFSLISWSVGTVWLGISAMWRQGVLLSRLKAINAQVLRCPRGHEVPLYGIWDCHCGSRVEGWAFVQCPICRESAGYVPCPVCELPVRNPLLP